MKGELTYLAEGNDNPQSQHYSQRLRLDSEGRLILGRGYRVYMKTREQLYQELVDAGILPQDATRLYSATKLPPLELTKFIKKYGPIYNITKAVEQNLFEIDYDLAERELYKFMKENSKRFGDMALGTMPPWFKDILMDLWYAGHISQHTQDIIFTAVSKAIRFNNPYFFERMLYHLKLWDMLGIPPERTKMRCIYIRDKQFMNNKLMAPVFGLPKDTVDDLFMNNPEAFCIEGIHYDPAMDEVTLVLQKTLNLTASAKQAIKQAISLNDLVLCLRILYDNTITHKCLGIAHKIDRDHISPGYNKLKKVIYPDYLEGKDIVKGMGLYNDLSQAVDILYKLHQGEFTIVDKTTNLDIENLEVPKELHYVGILSFPELEQRTNFLHMSTPAAIKPAPIKKTVTPDNLDMVTVDGGTDYSHTRESFSIRRKYKSPSMTFGSTPSSTFRPDVISFKPSESATEKYLISEFNRVREKSNINKLLGGVETPLKYPKTSRENFFREDTIETQNTKIEKEPALLITKTPSGKSNLNKNFFEGPMPTGLEAITTGKRPTMKIVDDDIINDQDKAAFPKAFKELRLPTSMTKLPTLAEIPSETVSPMIKRKGFTKIPTLNQENNTSKTIKEENSQDSSSPAFRFLPKTASKEGIEPKITTNSYKLRVHQYTNSQPDIFNHFKDVPYYDPDVIPKKPKLSSEIESNFSKEYKKSIFKKKVKSVERLHTAVSTARTTATPRTLNTLTNTNTEADSQIQTMRKIAILIRKYWLIADLVQTMESNQGGQLGKIFLVKNAKMKLEARYSRDLNSEYDTEEPIPNLKDPANLFSSKVSEVFEMLTKFYPCFARVKQISKAWAFAKWIKKNDMPIDKKVLSALNQRQMMRNAYKENIDEQVYFGAQVPTNTPQTNLGVKVTTTVTSKLTTKVLSKLLPSGTQVPVLNIPEITQVTPSDHKKLSARKVYKEELDELDIPLFGILIGRKDEKWDNELAIVKADDTSSDNGIARKLFFERQFITKMKGANEHVEDLIVDHYKVNFPLIPKICCNVCDRRLRFSEVFCQLNGKYYCRIHHPMSCGYCFKILTNGGYIKVGSTYFHPECIVCRHCGVQMDSHAKLYQMTDCVVHMHCKDEYSTLLQREIDFVMEEREKIKIAKKRASMLGIPHDGQ